MSGIKETYINVPPLHRHSSYHGGHAVATQTVPEHRGHHGVAVRDVGAILLRQSYDDLNPDNKYFAVTVA